MIGMLRGVLRVPKTWRPSSQVPNRRYATKNQGDSSLQVNARPKHVENKKESITESLSNPPAPPNPIPRRIAQERDVPQHYTTWKEMSGMDEYDYRSVMGRLGGVVSYLIEGGTDVERVKREFGVSDETLRTHYYPNTVEEHRQENLRKASPYVQACLAKLNQITNQDDDLELLDVVSVHSSMPYGCSSGIMRYHMHFRAMPKSKAETSHESSGLYCAVYIVWGEKEFHVVGCVRLENDCPGGSNVETLDKCLDAARSNAKTLGEFLKLPPEVDYRELRQRARETSRKREEMRRAKLGGSFLELSQEGAYEANHQYASKNQGDSSLQFCAHPEQIVNKKILINNPPVMPSPIARHIFQERDFSRYYTTSEETSGIDCILSSRDEPCPVFSHLTKGGADLERVKREFVVSDETFERYYFPTNLEEYFQKNWRLASPYIQACFAKLNQISNQADDFELLRVPFVDNSRPYGLLRRHMHFWAMRKTMGDPGHESSGFYCAVVYVWDVVEEQCYVVGCVLLKNDCPGCCNAETLAKCLDAARSDAKTLGELDDLPDEVDYGELCERARESSRKREEMRKAKGEQSELDEDTAFMTTTTDKEICGMTKGEDVF